MRKPKAYIKEVTCKERTAQNGQTVPSNTKHLTLNYAPNLYTISIQRLYILVKTVNTKKTRIKTNVSLPWINRGRGSGLRCLLWTLCDTQHMAVPYYALRTLRK